METIQVEILNPKAKKLLKDLADMNLINIGKANNTKTEFKALLTKLRSKAATAPSLDEITAEIEQVRASRYAGKAQ